jgi:RHS repeat-associated protein
MTVTHYIYDGFQLIGETDENNNVTRTYINEPDDFTHPIGHVDEDTGKPAYYHYDGQGNTRAVTDENGDVTDTFDYDSSGNVIARTGASEIPFQFCGEHGYYLDNETNNCYVMERTYDPSILRWLSADPIGLVEGLNRYLYTKNNPINFVDPSGTRCVREPPPDRLIPPEDPFFPTPAWRPFPRRGYITNVGSKGDSCASFTGLQCRLDNGECCTVDLEVCGTSYRYYRSPREGERIDHRGKGTGVSNDPRDFFSLVMLTVCLTNVICENDAQPDQKYTVMVGPLQKNNRGVFIRDIGGIEPTIESFNHKDPCQYAEELAEWLERQTQPGLISPAPR